MLRILYSILLFLVLAVDTHVQAAHSEYLQWAYQQAQSNESYFITSSLVATNDQKRGRFTFNGAQVVSIEVVSELGPERYVVIDELQRLAKGNCCRENFTMSPAGLFMFSLMHNGELLVTPMSRPPFSFFMQSRYPDEPPALFTTGPSELDVEESYDGKRENILPTAELIQKLDVEKNSYYGELLRLMSTFGHVSGKEIFELGEFMARTNDWNPGLVTLLPELVQTVVGSSGPGSSTAVRLEYRNDADDLAMKNVTASANHTFVIPYMFNAAKGGEKKAWAITYGEISQLMVIEAGILSSTQSEDETADFILHLSEGLDSFSIQHESSYRFLESYTLSELEFGFRTTNATKRAVFSVVTYEVDMVQLYGNYRANIVTSARFIEAFVADPAERDDYYSDLIALMAAGAQLDGFEVFQLGAFLTGLGSPIDSLPAPVRQICSGMPSRLAFEPTEGGDLLPLNGSWADPNGEFVREYYFTPHDQRDYWDGSQMWNVTYGESEQLYIEYLSFINVYRLRTRTNPTTRYEFRFYLHENLESISIDGSGVIYYTLEERSYSNTNGYDFEIGRKPSPEGAAFQVFPYQFNLTEWYAGRRQNILPTADFIHDSTLIDDKVLAYTELIRQMETNLHVEGKEVFELGAHLQAAAGSYEGVINLLPDVVRHVVCSSNATLSSTIYYENPSSTSYPFRYSWASDLHTPSLYTFEYSMEEDRFAITAGASNQWTIAFGDLMDIPSPSKYYSFQLHLSENLHDVHIHCYYNSTEHSNPLVTRNLEPDFYFSCNPNTTEPRDVFTVRSANA